jgi:hypothetical protein
MILGFKRKFPWGEPTLFKEKINYCLDKVNTLDRSMFPKVHSIRKGSRWKPGMLIHLAYGQRTKQYECFQLATVKTVQAVRIYTDIKEVWVAKRGIDNSYFIHFEKLSLKDVETLALNDGFDSVDLFWKWFNVDVDGQIISWVGKLYL